MSMAKIFNHHVKQIRARERGEKFTEPAPPVTKTTMAQFYVVIAIAIAVAIFIMPLFYIL